MSPPLTFSAFPTWPYPTAALIVGGSVITYMANMEAPAAGPLTKEKELLNGRAAMIGIASLLAVEAVKGVALL